MEKLIKFITALAPFLSAYPPWVKTIFSVWVILTAILFLSLVLSRIPTSDRAVEQTVSNSKKQTIIAESTVDRRIRELLGKQNKDVTAYLGEPDDKSIHRPSKSDIDMGRNLATTYVSYKRHGITFMLRGETVKTIFFYRQGVDGHLGYKRDVVEGLSPGMTRAEIESKFGRPTSIGGEGVVNYYVTYGGLIPDCSITINFDTKDVGDMSAVANVILIQSVGI